MFQASIIDNLNYFFILNFSSGVEVELYGSIEDDWFLRDDSDLLAKFVQVDFTDINSIDTDSARFNLDNAG
jgi:hypothetical protein